MSFADVFRQGLSIIKTRQPFSVYTALCEARRSGRITAFKKGNRRTVVNARKAGANGHFWLTI